MAERVVHFELNGKMVTRTVPEQRLEVDMLRDDLGLTGTKSACDDGMCGACTILLDGRPVKSCLLLAVQTHGRRVTTIEGLADDGELHPVQAALSDRFAIQCGFCTPGLALTLAAFLDDVEGPSEDDVRLALAGNICRCTGYVRIVDAAMDVARRRDREPGTAASGDPS